MSFYSKKNRVDPRDYFKAPEDYRMEKEKDLVGFDGYRKVMSEKPGDFGYRDEDKYRMNNEGDGKDDFRSILSMPNYNPIKYTNLDSL